MSVLIRGMNMPRDCHLCPISHWNKLDEFTGCELKKRFFSKEELNQSGRPDFCPLIEIPPHGRLIDADALMDALTRAKEDDPIQYEEDYLAVSDWLCVVPTIIEAEGGRDMIPWIYADLDTIIDSYSEPPKDGE